MHGSHSVLPELEVNLPSGQRSQTAMPFLLAHPPGKHALHALALVLPGTGLALPGAHATQEALLVAPVTSLYVPAGQG